MSFLTVASQGLAAGLGEGVRVWPFLIVVLCSRSSDCLFWQEACWVHQVENCDCQDYHQGVEGNEEVFTTDDSAAPTVDKLDCTID